MFKKRTRSKSRRKFTRRRRVARKKSTLATKTYVQRAITRKQESKMVQIVDSLAYNTETFPSVWYNRHLMYQYCVPGVTDRGRIGDTINASGIRFNYKIQVSRADGSIECRPFTWHMFLVQPKNTYFSPTTMWYKAKDRGADQPYEPLSEENAQNGLNVLNTDSYKILAHKQITLQPTVDNPYKQLTGSFYVNLKQKKIKLLNNGVTSNAQQEVIPQIQAIIYPYWGDTGGGSGAEYQGLWAIGYSIMQFYKD